MNFLHILTVHTYNNVNKFTTLLNPNDLINYVFVLDQKFKIQ